MLMRDGAIGSLFAKVRILCLRTNCVRTLLAFPSYEVLSREVRDVACCMWAYTLH